MKTIIAILSMAIMACGVQSKLPVTQTVPTNVATELSDNGTFPYFATVNTDALNVRECPSTDCQIVSQLTKGAQVTVYETVDTDDKLCDRWARIQYGMYVCERFIK